MTSRIVNRGLLSIGRNASHSTGFSTSRFIQTLSVDDSTNVFGQTDSALNSAGSFTNSFDQAIATTPTETSQTIRHSVTIVTSDAAFTHRRIALHDDTAANVTTGSSSVVAGIDGQSIAKTTEFSLTYTLDLTYTSV